MIKRVSVNNKNKRGCRLLLLLAMLLLIAKNVDAQADIHFSQFYETSILRNPALTGVFADDFKLGVYYRNQWSSITHPYETKLFSGEARVEISEMSYDFFSFGLLAFSDKAGSIDQKINAIYPAINYNKSMNVEHNSYLSVGFTGGNLSYSFDPSKATFNNQFQGGRFDPNLPPLENLTSAKMSFWDLGAGVNYNTSVGYDNEITYIIGVSGYHFTQPKFSYYETEGVKQNIRMNANAAASFNIIPDVGVQLQANTAFQGAYKELMGGGLVSWTKQLAERKLFVLTGGLFYRYRDAAIPVVKVKYNNMALGLSYDVNISRLKDASRMQGGLEVTLFMSGDFTYKGINKKKVCPKF